MKGLIGGERFMGEYHVLVFTKEYGGTGYLCCLRVVGSMIDVGKLD